VKFRRRLSNERGAATVEMILVLPMLLFMLRGATPQGTVDIPWQDIQTLRIHR
jgi:hypothetical protein